MARVEVPEGQKAAASAQNAQKKKRCKCTVTWACVRNFILRNFLPLGFLLCIVWMLAWPWPGEKVASWKVGTYNIVETICILVIFVISGLGLKTEEILLAIRHPGPLIYGVVAILGVTPCIGFATILLPLKPREFAIGLTAFAIGPSTLAQGQTLVAQAGGNTALALMLLVVTNLLAVFTVPFLFKAILSSDSSGGSVTLSPTSLLINLIITVLAPAIVGKVVRDLIRAVGKWVSSHRTTMSLLNNGSLLIIVWIQLCSAHDRLMQQAFGNIVLIIVASVLLHFVFVAFNWPMIVLLRFPPREAVAALIMSSQKTMPFAVSIVALLPASFGSKGLLTLPPLVSQMCQLFCDIWIARYWGKKIAAEKQAQEIAEKLPVTNRQARGSSNGGASPLGPIAAAGNGAAAPRDATRAPADGDGLAERPAAIRLNGLEPAQTLQQEDGNAPDFLHRASSCRRHSLHSAHAYGADCGSIEVPPSDIERVSGATAVSLPTSSRRSLSIRLPSINSK